MKMSLAFVTAVALAPSVHAANWVEIGGNDSVTTYVDTESMRRIGPKVKTWLKWEWAKPESVPNTYPAKTYLLEKQLQISDCVAGKLAVIQGTRYASLGGADVADSYSIAEGKAMYTEVVPETIGESILKFACAPKKKAGAKP